MYVTRVSETTAVALQAKRLVLALQMMMPWLSWLSLVGCVGDGAEVAKEKEPPVEYNCFCFPVAGEDEPVFIPDGESYVSYVVQAVPCSVKYTRYEEVLTCDVQQAVL